MTARELFEQYRGCHPISTRVPIEEQVLAAGPPGSKIQIRRVVRPLWDAQPLHIKNVWLRKAVDLL